jgi:hypothetical protein
MTSPKPPWYDRFLAALPRLPDWTMPVFLLAMVFLLGVLVGGVIQATIEVNRVAARFTGVVQEHPLHQRLEALEERVKALEGKGTP